MNKTKLIRIAVASDLHAHSNHDKSPSHLNVSAPEAMSNLHPIAGLLDLISRESLTATALLSPGDLGHMADPQGIGYAWAALKRVSDALTADFYTATAGNHDIDSRYQGDDHSPEHILKGLTPQFPLGPERLENNQYWARAYAIKDHELFRLVLLNSSAYHGHTETEKNHGRIDRQTLDELASALSTRGRREINIILCHHHPHQHSEAGLGEADVMKQGQLLLDVLGSGKFGEWLVIHGHKHHPKISYSAGGAASPIIFSAGSLCCTLYRELQTIARNQFYLIEIDPSDYPIRGLAGRIRAWDWVTGGGWIEARDGSGLPSESGFGTRTTPRRMAEQIAKLVGDAAIVKWGKVVTTIPDINFVLPQDFDRIQAELEEIHSITVQRNGSRPVEIGRKL